MTPTATGKTPPPETIDNVFPRHSGKTYALAEVMPGETPMVGKGPEGTVFAYPVVLLWEMVLFLGVTLSIFLFSLFKSAPLEEIANPLVTTDPAKAPWYFLGLQELLEHMHPVAAGVLLPAAFIVFLAAVPYMDGARAGAGRWFGSTRRSGHGGAWPAGPPFTASWSCPPTSHSTTRLRCGSCSGTAGPNG